MELSVYVQIMAYGMVGSITLLPLSPVIVQSEEMKALPVECGSSEQVIAIMTAHKKTSVAGTEKSDSESDGAAALKSQEKGLLPCGKSFSGLSRR